MEYQGALEMLTKVAKKYQMNITTLTPGQEEGQQVDLGLRDFLSMSEDYDRLFRETMLTARENTIYRFQDQFFCRYLYLILPDTPRHTVLIAGPYITFELRREEFTARLDRFGVPPWLHRQVEEYYFNLPVFQDTTILLNLFTAFGEIIWGGAEKFRIVELGQEAEPRLLLSYPAPPERGEQSILMEMQLMKARYDSENEMMQAVSRGQVYRAEQFLAAVPQGHIRQRVTDPVRNMKNYGVIFNTLLRKAAEQGGVHPLYLDALSSDFAGRIENMSSVSAVQDLFQEMVRGYCRLVRKHTARHYSPPVEKAVLLIESDLSQELGLKSLAAKLNLSPGYLSALFRQETGKTITDFVNEKRAEHAAALLRGSTLQVQTVAQYCGISDVNYFSKIFKRYHGVTPREYRRENDNN